MHDAALRFLFLYKKLRVYYNKSGINKIIVGRDLYIIR